MKRPTIVLPFHRRRRNSRRNRCRKQTDSPTNSSGGKRDCSNCATPPAQTEGAIEIPVVHFDDFVEVLDTINELSSDLTLSPQTVTPCRKPPADLSLPKPCTLPPAHHMEKDDDLSPTSLVSSTNSHSTATTLSPTMSIASEKVPDDIGTVDDDTLLMPYNKKAASTTTTSPPGLQRPPVPSHPLLDSRYKVGNKLGRGCFATVYQATRLSDNEKVAIKVIEKDKLDEETEILLNNELQILQAVSRHPGIVTLLDHIETDTHMFFVMDYVEGGPLLDRIVSRGSFSENDARILLRTILSTLQFLDELGCVHRDIKPENILVDNHSSTWPVKLTDFGLSAKMQQDQLLYDALGTPLFVAPEILNGQGYDSSCDMWSLGVVMYIVLCGYPPFPYSETPATLIDAIIHGRYDFPRGEWDHVSADAKHIVCRMLEIDPSKRITPSEALNHQWVAHVQSTSDLPNRKLRSFNARRKLKASVCAIRTMNIVSRGVRALTAQGGHDRQACQQPESNEELLRDVERARVLIEKMGFGLDGKRKGPSMHDRDGASFDSEFLMSRGTGGNRRSLILPVNSIVGGTDDMTKAGNHDLGGHNHFQYPPQQGSTQSKRQVWMGHICGSRMGQLDAHTSQFMESKANAMVAEVYQSTIVGNDTNPFMTFAQQQQQQQQQPSRTTAPQSSSTPQGQAQADDVTNQAEKPSAGRPVALASLDLGLLGF